MYLIAYIGLLIYYIKIDSYVINVGDVSLTHSNTITPLDPDSVPDGLLLMYRYIGCY